jgi:hypothetical protein
MSLSLHIPPGTQWGQWLSKLNAPLDHEAISPGTQSRPYSDKAGASTNGRPPVAGHWGQTELVLWNEALPSALGSDSSAQAPITRQSPVALLTEVIRISVAVNENTLAIHMPIPCFIGGKLAGKEVAWRVRTEYPRAGYTEITWLGPSSARHGLAIRVEDVAHNSLQILRCGLPTNPEALDGYVTLPGPWRPGDSVQVRHGIPFQVVTTSGKLLTHSYPGAPTALNAFVYHGVREIVPFPHPGVASVAPELAVTVGVRKDGTLLLRNTPGSKVSHAQPGDIWETGHTNPVLLAARAVASQMGFSHDRSPAPFPFTLKFDAFETTFDHGA